MSSKEEICSKVFDFQQRPSKLLLLFSSFFKPLFEIDSLSRLAGRKLSQSYCPALISIIKQSLSELSKKAHEDYSEYFLELTQTSLSLLSKIYIHYFENNEEYYNLWYSFLIRLNDFGKFKETLKISSKILEELEKTEYFVMITNFYVLICNCILQINNKGIKGLEQVYDLLAIKCKSILISHKKNFDGQTLNKLYQNLFKLLMKTGKILDNLAGGNISFHEQALSIRSASLQFLQKTRPFLSTDYFAFVYSSVLGTYKIALTCNSKTLYCACIDSIDSSLDLPSLPLNHDKNLRNLIELKSFLYFKVENYAKIKPTLSLLASNGENIVSLLYNIKYALDMARASYLGKLELIIDLETCLTYLSDFFDNKLTCPSVLNTSELIEMKEIAPKVLSQFDNWTKTIGNLHNPNTIKSGILLPTSSLKLILDMLKFVPKFVRFQEKLAVSIQIDLCLYHYIMFLNFILLYTSTRESSNLALIYRHLGEVLKFKDNKFISNCYNISLALIHCGEKEIAVKISILLVDSLNSINSISVSIIELASKHVSENAVQIKHVIKSLYEFLHRQIGCGSHKSQEVRKIVEVFSWLQFKEIELTGDSLNNLINLEGDQELVSVVLETQLECYYKKILGFKKKVTKECEFAVEHIQDIVQALLWKIHQTYSSQYISVLVYYIEIVCACSEIFTNETVLSRLSSELASYQIYSQQEQIFTVIEFMIHKTADPMLMIWNAILIFEQIKDIEKSVQSEWISKESVVNYCKIVDVFRKSIYLFAEKLGCRVFLDEPEIIRNDCDEKYQVSNQEIKSLCLASEVSRMVKLYDLEILFIDLIIIALQNSKAEEHNVECLLYRKKICLILYGKDYNKTLPEIAEIKENNQSDIFYTRCWSKFYDAEIFFLEGNIEESQKILSKLLVFFPENQNHLKKNQLLKASILYLLSRISLMQGNYHSSLSLCKESRGLLKDSQLTTLTFHNLSLSSSISSNPSKRSILVYPQSSWSFQHLSSLLINFLSDLYCHLSQISLSVILLSQGARLGRLLGIPSVFLYFRSKLCTLYRQSLNDLIHDNIKEQQLEIINPVDFVEEIFQQYFNYFLEIVNNDSKTNSFQCIVMEDTEEICKYIDRESFCMALMTVGDILQTPSLYNRIESKSTDQSYYNLCKYLLSIKYCNYQFTILRSLLFRKLALLSYRQNPEKSCIGLIEKSALQIACCSKYLEKSCCGLRISPLLCEEFAHSLLNLADSLLKQSKSCNPLLEYVLNLPNTSNPVIRNHANYLISRDPNQDPFQRSFFTFQSIGNAYNSQAFYSQYENSEEFFNDLRVVPEEWTVVGISVGRGNFYEGTMISKVQSGRKPESFLIGNKCCTGNRPVYEFFETFAEIMKESAMTTAKNAGVIKVNSAQWWDKRERLNENLKNLLENVETQYFGILCGLMIGRVKDKKIDCLVYSATQELVPEKSCFCGQVWGSQVIYGLFVGFLCDLLSLDFLKSCLTTSIYAKKGPDILKKLGNLKKQVSDPKNLEISPTILIISGQMLHFPWESLPVLQKSYTTRVPSLKFLLSRIPSPQLQYQNAFYMLNPSKDLESTQRTFSPFFASHLSWRGLTEEAPSETDFSEALTQKDLVIYCGHSSGEQYLKGEKIRDLKVKAAVFLMGCSSGLLRAQGNFDPQGIAIQYMLASCPALLANLWDVTDKDIDRFALEVFKRIEQGESLGKATHFARNSCKLKYLIGSAPVWYGVPIEFLFS